MGERITPECDIFKTLQPKGLRTLQVIVCEMSEAIPVDGNAKWEVSEGKPLVTKMLQVGNPGADRILRMVQAACQPPKTRKPTERKAPGDA